MLMKRTSVYTHILLPWMILGLLALLLWQLGPVSYIFPARAATNSFVTRSGSQLILNGHQFRFAGANIYWLGLDDGAQTYPTAYRIEDAMITANELGLTVVRAHSLGVSTGCAFCVEPQLNRFNETALQHIDYAIKVAHEHSIRLIIPFTDNYHFYHGGKHSFTDWRGISDENQFYTNPQVINDFKQYIHMFLNRVNSYTGIAYKDDPTILAWETGNELLSPSNWTQNIASDLKSIDHHHLVVDGNYGINLSSLTLPDVDIYSDHLYPPNVTRLAADAMETNNANKALLIGEYDWAVDDGSTLSTFLRAAKNNVHVAGDFFWDIWSHDDVSGYRSGIGGLNMAYPGDTPDRRARTLTILSHAYSMSGIRMPGDRLPGIPMITNVNNSTIFWRGAPLGDTYSIERSSIGFNGPWTVICNRCTTDYAQPWTDSSYPPTRGTWYRIRAYNRSGMPGNYSTVYGLPGAPKLVDDLNDWSKSDSHNPNVHINTGDSDHFNGDTARAYRWNIDPNQPDYIVWKFPKATAFTAIGYFWPTQPNSHFTFYVSANATNWTLATPSIVGGAGDWSRYIYTLNNLQNTNYIKINWNNSGGPAWTPQLGQVLIN